MALKVCQGHRPNIDELKIPQELKNLIKSCWDTDPQKRPTAKEAHNIIRKLYNNHYSNYWNFKIEEYDSFSQNTPYKIHSTSITTSKLINTKEINQRLQSSQLSNESSQP